MEQIHIAHVIYRFSTGGLENGVVNLINLLPEENYKHSIICITDHDENFFKRITTKKTKIYNLHKPAGRSLKWLFNCWKLLRQLNPDICHSRNLNPLEAQLAVFFAGVKFRIHGEHGWDINDLGGTNVKYQKLRRLFKPFLHQYVALSSEAKNYLIDKIGVNHKRINQICNGVDIEKFSPKVSTAEVPLFIQCEDAIVFGTVGRLAKVKNQTFLLKAFLLLWQSSDKNKQRLKLIIVGDGELMPTLREMVQEAGAENSVWLAGLRDDVSDLMNCMNVFVLPSLAEGISNTLLEAMACGLPCIATRVGGNADLIYPDHLKTHLVSVNDVEQLVMAMKVYADSPALLEQECKTIRQYCVDKFSIKSMVNKYHALYQLGFNKR